MLSFDFEAYGCINENPFRNLMYLLQSTLPTYHELDLVHSFRKLTDEIPNPEEFQVLGWFERHAEKFAK